MRIFSALFSPDGSLVAAADDQSHIRIWEAQSISDVLDQSLKDVSQEQTVDSFAVFDAEDGPIYALQLFENILISGGDTSIKIWNIHGQSEAITTLRSPKIVTSSGVVLPPPETNGLAVCPENKTLFSASGDSNVYMWDLETGAVASTFKGHEDFVHCVELISPSLIASGSEDGTVRLWDVRSEECTCVLSPERNDRTSRKAPGPNTPWVACLAVKDDWLICGGGGCIISKFHIPSRSLVQTMPTPAALQSLSFHEQNSVLSVGAEPWLYTWDASGKLVGRIQAHSESLFSVAVNPNPMGRPRVLAAGSSNFIDAFMDTLMPSSSFVFEPEAPDRDHS